MTEREPQQRPVGINGWPQKHATNAGMIAPARESITADPQRQPQPEPQRRAVTKSDLAALGHRFAQWGHTAESEDHAATDLGAAEAAR